MASKENQEALNRVKDCHDCGAWLYCENCFDINTLQQAIDRLEELENATPQEYVELRSKTVLNLRKILELYKKKYGMALNELQNSNFISPYVSVRSDDMEETWDEYFTRKTKEELEDGK